MTDDQVKSAQHILYQHEFNQRFIPSDVRGLLQQIIRDHETAKHEEQSK